MVLGLFLWDRFAVVMRSITSRCAIMDLRGRGAGRGLLDGAHRR